LESIVVGLLKIEDFKDLVFDLLAKHLARWRLQTIPWHKFCLEIFSVCICKIIRNWIRTIWCNLKRYFLFTLWRVFF